MFKLIKYEFKSKSNYVIAALVILVLLNFRIYIKNVNSDSRIISILITNSAWYVINFFVLIIFNSYSFSKILFTDEGSLIFLTPLNSYEIIGSKILAGLLDVFALLNITTAVFFINFQLTDSTLLIQGIELLKLAGINIIEILPIIVILMFLSYGLLIPTIFLSMILVKTIFYNIKYNKVLSFMVFIFISYLNQLIISNIVNNRLDYNRISVFVLVDIFIKTTLIITLWYMISGFLLEEKKYL